MRKPPAALTLVALAAAVAISGGACSSTESDSNDGPGTDRVDAGAESDARNPAGSDTSSSESSTDDTRSPTPGPDGSADGSSADYDWSDPNDVEPTLVAKRRSSPVEIDGELDEAEYGAAMSYEFGDLSGESDNHATYWALWDEDHLYLAARIADDSIQYNPDADAFENDSAELLIDPRRDRSPEIRSDDLHLFGLPEAGTVVKTGGAEGFEVDESIEIEANHTRSSAVYRVELRIPWADLDAEPERHRRLGLALAVNDLDGEEDLQFSWDSSDSLLEPSSWGDLRLGGESPADDVPPPGDDTSDPGPNGCTYEEGPQPNITQTVDLADEGLEEGDAIGPYLDEYFQPGNEVVIPAGRYSWDGDFGGDFDDDALLCSEGRAVFEAPDETPHNGTITATDGALVRFANITFEGVAAAGKNRIAFQALDSDARIQIIGVRHPDGSPHGGHPSPIGFFVRSDNVGEILFKNCYAANFPNNGLYISDHSGRVVVEGCVFENNEVDNLRLANNDVARDVLIIMEGGPYGHTGRGIRFRYPGSPTLQNVHIVNATGPSPIQTGSASRMDGTVEATLEDVFIQNDGGGTPIDMKVGEASATNVHITGAGDLSPDGVSGDVCTGSSCTSPETDIDAIR